MKKNKGKDMRPEEHLRKTGRKRRLLWLLIFLLLAIGSIWVVMQQNRVFTLREFLGYLQSASPFWLGLAVLCMLAFIVMEGVALRSILGSFGYKTSLGKAVGYSASDIYFSAITPSATGGQPACAYFMMRDGIPGMIATVALLVNVMMYTLAMLVIGAFSFCVSPGLFLRLSHLSKMMIVIGGVIQVGLSGFLILLIKNEKLLHRICRSVILFFAKIRLLRRREERLAALASYMEEYRGYAVQIHGKRGMLLRAFLLNFLQRTAQLSVALCCYMATGGSLSNALSLWSIQIFVVIGANCIPIPGAIGATDYMLLDGFGTIMAPLAATQLELLSRALSFYSCIILSAVFMGILYLVQRKRSDDHDRVL